MSARFEQGRTLGLSCLGHEQLTVANTAVALPNLPDLGKLRIAVIRNLDQPINWRDDGTDPTGSLGFPALANEIVVFNGEFDKLKLILDAAATGSADVRIAYYGT